MIKFNASMGKKHWLMINCMWYRSHFRCQAGLLHTFRLFCPKTSKLESAVFSQQKIFCLVHHHSLLLNAQRKNHLYERWFVLTTCRAITKGLASLFVYWSCTKDGTKSWRFVEGRIVSQYNSLVIHKFIHFMLLFRHNMCFAFSF